MLKFFIVLLVAVSIDLSHQYSAIDGLKACYVGTEGWSYVGSPPITYSFKKFNDGEWRVKELRLYYGTNMFGRFFWPGPDQTPGSVKSWPDNDARTTFEFIYANDTKECFTATVPWYRSIINENIRVDCPQDISRSACPLRPRFDLVSHCPGVNGTDCADDQNYENQWQCNNGLCLRQFADTRCQDLYATTTVQLQTQSSSLIYSGFRLSDCARNPVRADADELVIVENGLVLLPIETKSNLTVLRDSENFVQLMVGMCPRTLLVLEELISSLHSFVATSNMDTTYISLAAFDGALDVVTLLPFTKNITAIQNAIDNLREYIQRDSSCNVKQAVLVKFRELKSSLYGQPWDRTFYIIFSASLDITNFVPDYDIALEFSTDREIFTYFIGLNIPESQISVFSAVGTAGFISLNRESDIMEQFIDLAKIIEFSYTNEYLLGYCSPSRTNKIKVEMSLTLSSGNKAMIQQFPLDAANFGGKCSTSDVVQSLCSDCTRKDTTLLQRGNILCYNCFTASSVSLRVQRQSQVLLRYPAGEGLVLHITATRAIGKYDIYFRKNAVCHRWLYDYELKSITLTQIPLDSFSEGDLVCVYIDFKGNVYNYDLSIAPLVVDPPLTPVAPVTPVKPPVRYIPPKPAVPVVVPPTPVGKAPINSTDNEISNSTTVVVSLASLLVSALATFLI